MYETPLIQDPQNRLAYAHLIARTANGHTQYARPLSKDNNYDEPLESKKYTEQVLSRDMLILLGMDYDDVYSGHGCRSEELSAALEIAICVFAEKIVEIHAEPDATARTNRMRTFGLISTMPGAEQETLEAAKNTLFLSQRAATYLQNPENRERMRQRFIDANLSDDMIAKFTPQSSTTAATPTPAT